MSFRLTKESMEALVEEIVDAVEFSRDDRDMQFEMVRTILIDNGIEEIEEQEDNHENWNLSWIYG